MTSGQEFRPDWASAPGETIADVLDERGVSVAEFADHIEQSLDQAQQLAERVGTATPPIWMPGVMDNLEAQVYPSMKAAAAALGKQVTRELTTLFAKNPPTKPITLRFTGRPNPRGLDQQSIDAAAAALLLLGLALAAFWLFDKGGRVDAEA